MQIGLKSILSLFSMLFRCGCLPDLCFAFANPLALEVHGRKISRREVLLTPSNAITKTPVLDKGKCYHICYTDVTLTSNFVGGLFMENVILQRKRQLLAKVCGQISPKIIAL